MRTILPGTLLATLLIALLSACSEPPELPPTAPLSATPEQLARIPNLERGDHTVASSPPLDWIDGDRTLRVRVLYPQPAADAPRNPERFPLVIFSHGNWSGITQYDALLEHWASHGYVVVLPYHADGGGMARGIFNSLRFGNEGLIAARVADVKWILDRLPQLDTLIPELAGHIDSGRIAVAGHSFGAFTAQQTGGAAAVDPVSGNRVEGRDPRVQAIVAISPPGPMFDIINEQSWLRVDTPMLVTTGTWDVNARFWPDWRQHTLSYRTASPGANWLLVIEGADHYLGNLICRPERKVEPQADALRMVNALSVTFLHAFLNDDAQARQFLEARPLRQLTDGFASLSHR